MRVVSVAGNPAQVHVRRGYGVVFTYWSESCGIPSIVHIYGGGSPLYTIGSGVLPRRTHIVEIPQDSDQ